MTKKLEFDDGILELEINGRGLLRFNASDINVYQRLMVLVKELPEMEKEYNAKTGTVLAAKDGAEQGASEPDTPDEEKEPDLEAASALMDQAREMDRKIKEKFAWAFGPENDFDQLLDGVNLMAFGRNGERVIVNLLNALLPYFEGGVKQYQKEAAEEAVAQAKKNRAQRRALQ